MRIGVLAETKAGERRVAVTPAVVSKYIKRGVDVFVQAGAGHHSGFLDESYVKEGAFISHNRPELCASSDLILSLEPPTKDDVSHMRAECYVIAQFGPFAHKNILKALSQKKIYAFSVLFIPRITRAQSMDVLSSQANLAGYRAAIDAAAAYGGAFPLMMTPAGTVPAARVFVMGVGVAGLQAIATARRLGAIVSATDVRPATKEQVISLGAQFIAVEDEEFLQAETKGGYAKEMSLCYQQKQAALVESHLKKQDVIITTALLPHHPAPKLISTDMLGLLKPQSIIVDLAVERGGNCALSQEGKVVTTHSGVKIIGTSGVQGASASASELYARNMLAYIDIFVDKGADMLLPPWEDEIITSTLITRDGEIVHPQFHTSATKESHSDGI